MTTRILLLSGDPYLAFLLSQLPDGPTVTPADGGMSTAAVLAVGCDIVVCERDDPRCPELAAALGPRLIGVASGATARSGDIARPLAAARVWSTVARAVAPGVPGNDPLVLFSRAAPLLLLVAAISGTVVAISGTTTATTIVAGGLAILHGATRRTMSRGWAGPIVDAVASVLVFGLTGGLFGPFVVYVTVAVIGAGLATGPGRGAAIGLLVGVAGVVGAGWQGGGPPDLAAPLIPLLLLPLAGLAAGIVSRSSSVEAQAAATVAATDRLMRDLQAVASSGDSAVLRLGDVIRRTADEVQAVTGATELILCLVELDRLVVASATGVQLAVGTSLPIHQAPWLATTQVRRLSSDELPEAFHPVLSTTGPWTVAPLRSASTVWGVVLLPDEVARGKRHALESVLRRSAGAVATARLFARVQTDAVDAERRRLAGELHDSTAQVLTHVRMELELLGQDGGALAPELQRLARVVLRAQGDLRDVITGLRDSVADDGLAGALHAYVADLRSGSDRTDLTFTATGRRAFPPDVEQQVFRVGQEAISNAMQHAAAACIDVRISADDDRLELIVSDDGQGWAESGPPGGLGVEQMRSRARRLGGTLSIASGASGTTVNLDIPVDGGTRTDLPALAGDRTEG